jgi:hypothetical protein
MIYSKCGRVGSVYHDIAVFPPAGGAVATLRRPIANLVLSDRYADVVDTRDFTGFSHFYQIETTMKERFPRMTLQEEPVTDFTPRVPRMHITLVNEEFTLVIYLK